MCVSRLIVTHISPKAVNHIIQAQSARVEVAQLCDWSVRERSVVLQFGTDGV